MLVSVPSLKIKYVVTLTTNMLEKMLPLADIGL